MVREEARRWACRGTHAPRAGHNDGVWAGQFLHAAAHHQGTHARARVRVRPPLAAEAKGHRCAAQENTPAPSLRYVVAVLRMSLHDPDIFYKFKQTLIDKAPYASDKQRSDLKLDAIKVFENYYPLQQSKDVPFEIGRLLMGLKDHAAAIKFFQDSQKYCGEHHVSWCATAHRRRVGSERSCPARRYNMGLCYNYIDDLDQAIACFNRSLQLCPDYHDARAWRARVESRRAMSAQRPAEAVSAEEHEHEQHRHARRDTEESDMTD